MRILCLDIPTSDATLEKYAPHLNSEALHAWGLYKSGVIRDIYFRQDRPGVAIFLECDSVETARTVMADFPLAKAGLLAFECIPLDSFTNWENLFAEEFKSHSEETIK
ncbi:superoxide dismutase [Serratia proteamaculans]|uniref:superoxide dismutase n=1 Tax=Serratia proteamaculans TaxID=28151 RepID=UPI001C57D5DD|nr:superoxide dismutase [Serratia proteamaculans]WEO87944.1 superoxide dismutase [Serratia proteamaculans]